MAKVLKHFEFNNNGGQSRYPWKQWADGEIRELKQGEDYTCKTQTMAMMARQYGRKNGYTTRVASNKETDTVVIQFFKPPNDTTPAPTAKREKAVAK